MVELKTKLTGEPMQDFLAKLDSPQKKADCYIVAALMEKITGSPAEMWGDSIVGFGRYHYQYASGRAADWMLTGFSPRKQNLTLYIMSGFDQYDELMSRLGKFKTGKSCLYVKTLADVDMEILEELIQKSVEHMRATNSPA